MRSVAAGLAAVALTAGCNQIFGLVPTGELPPVDAPPDAAPGTVKLTRQLQDTDTAGKQTATTYPAFDVAPILLQTAAGDDALSDVPYGVDGVIEVPLFDSDGHGHVNPYRLVYQLDAMSVPHEVQWNLQLGHLVVPEFGHPVRLAPPAGAGYDFRPSNAPATVTEPIPFVVAYTTGATSVAHGLLAGNEFSYTLASATALDGGRLGTPTVAAGDSEVLVELNEQTGVVGTFAAAYATMMVDVSGSRTIGTPAWNLGTTIGVPTVSINLPADSFDQRIGNALDPSLRNSEDHNFTGGAVPNSTMPCFSIPSGNGGLDTSMIFQLAFATSRPTDLSWVNPFADTMVNAVIETRIQTRAAGGGTLASGLQSQFTPGAAPSLADLASPAAMPSKAMLDGTLLTLDNTAITIGTSGFVTLTFDGNETGFRNDDFIVTLLEISATGITPVRVFQVVLPSVRIPTEVLDNGKTYAVQIVGRNGFPNVADSGDYTVPRSQTSPMACGTATLVPGTFVVTKS